MRSVIQVQAPSEAASNSCGDNPNPAPPFDGGSSAIKEAVAPVSCVVYRSLPICAVTCCIMRVSKANFGIRS